VDFHYFAQPFYQRNFRGMPICRNAEGVLCQRKIGSHCSGEINWQVMELQSGVKIQDLQLNPPAAKGVNYHELFSFCINMICISGKGDMHFRNYTIV